MSPGRLDTLFVLLLVALILVVGVPRNLERIDICDEGFLACGAMRVYDGEVPNRDFVTLQPPLSFYTIALLFRSFGVSLVVMRSLGLAMAVACALLVYAITRQLARPFAAFLGASLLSVLGIGFFYYTPFPVWHGIVFALASVLLTIRAALTSKIGWARWAGVLAALATTSRHDQGAYVLIATLASVLLTSGRHERAPFETSVTKGPGTGRLLGNWLAGFGAVLLPLLAYWAAIGAAQPMFDQLIAFLLTRYRETSSQPFPSWAGSIPLSTGGSFPKFLFYVPPLIIGIAAVRLVRSATRDARTLSLVPVLAVVFATLFYLQVLTRPDPWHLIITLPPCFVLAGWLMDWALEKARRAAPVLLAASVAVSLAAAHATFFPTDDVPKAPLDLPRGGVVIDEDLGDLFERVVRRTQALSPAERPILVVPYAPMFYFLAERRNPTRWNYLWPGDQTQEDYEAMIAQMESEPPATIVILGRDSMAGYAQRLLEFVDERYRLVEQENVFEFYVERVP